ncbi:MAG TPA: DUF190 domain-containing protein, partial [Arachidicoccus soli]|nr:DUF190 domain-containing protein [Arachidicoccus soli]
MSKRIITQKMGKLRIYIPPSDKIRHDRRKLFRRVFPKSSYIHILEDAQTEGILNASVYNTHSGFNKKEKNQSFTAEGDNSKLNMCVELIDSRENGERFFLRNYNHLKGKVA